jgi:hypothetical protein
MRNQSTVLLRYMERCDVTTVLKDSGCDLAGFFMHFLLLVKVGSDPKISGYETLIFFYDQRLNDAM